MEKIEANELLKWVTSYYYEERENGIGVCQAVVCVRDGAENMRYTFDTMTDTEKMSIMCALIEKVAYPCEDYDKDFFDPNSPFGFVCRWDDDKKGIRFSANFRV